jgi:hypothetical protein
MKHESCTPNEGYETAIRRAAAVHPIPPGSAGFSRAPGFEAIA